MKRSTAAISLAISASVILSGCSSSPSATSDSSSIAEEQASPTPVEILLAIPQVGDCWDQANLDHWVLEGILTSCVNEHTGQTVWTGVLPDTVVDNPFTDMEDFKAANAGVDGKVDWESVSDADRADYDAQLALLDNSFKECRVELNKLIGASSPDGSTMLTILSTDVTGPSRGEWAEGARWIRCNTAAKVPVNEGDPLAGLMALPQRLHDVMRTKIGRQFNYCWKNGNTGTERAICGTPEAKGMWLTISTSFPQKPGLPWVSKKWAAEKAVDFCRIATDDYWNLKETFIKGWGRHLDAQGKSVNGDTKATWSTDKATFACAILQGGYKYPTT